MDLEIDGEKICLLTDENKKMLNRFIRESDSLDLITVVYVIAVTAFMEGLKYTKEKDHE
jgi:hypothetical protein